MSITFTAEVRDQLPPEDDRYTSEGTLAHEVAEFCVKQKLKFDPKAIGPRASREIWGYGEAYADFVLGLRKTNSDGVTLEQDVPLWYMPDGSKGHVDAVVNTQGEIHVIDYKYGKWHHVHAENNLQMAIYAIGYILNTYKGGCDDAEKISMHIYQPRSVKRDREFDWETWTTTWGKLQLLAASKIDIAAHTILDPSMAHLRKFRPSPETCMGCKAKSLCKARAEERADWFFGNEEEPKEHKPVHALTPKEIGWYLQRADATIKWLNELEQMAYHLALKGTKVPGHKLVVGKGSREWIDDGLALLTMLELIPDGTVWMTKPKVLSPHGVEEAIKNLPLKKADLALLKDYIVKKQGKLTLVDEADERKEASPLNHFENLDDDTDWL